MCVGGVVWGKGLCGDVLFCTISMAGSFVTTPTVSPRPWFCQESWFFLSPRLHHASGFLTHMVCSRPWLYYTHGFTTPGISLQPWLHHAQGFTMPLTAPLLQFHHAQDFTAHSFTKPTASPRPRFSHAHDITTPIV